MKVLRVVLKALVAVLSFTQAAVSMEIAIPLLVRDLVSNNQYDVEDLLNSFSASASPVAISAEYEEFIPCVEYSTSSPQDSHIDVYRNIVSAIISNDSETFCDLLIEQSDCERLFRLVRNTTDIEQGDLVDAAFCGRYSILGATILATSSPNLPGLVTINRDKVRGTFSWPTPILQIFATYRILLGRNSPLATPVDVSGYENVVLPFCLSTLCDFSTRIHFRGFIPSWGRRVLEDGKLVIDPEEEIHAQDESYPLIRFARDTWHMRSMIPNSVELRDSPEFQAYNARLGIYAQEALTARWITAKGYEERPPIARQFEYANRWVRLLYIIDADPFFLILWSPSDSLPEDESYKENGLPFAAEANYRDRYGADLYQRVGDTFALVDMDILQLEGITKLFKWYELQHSVVEFIQDKYVNMNK